MISNIDLKYLIIISILLCHVQIAVSQIGLSNNDVLFVDKNTVVFVKGDFINSHKNFENNGEFTLLGDLENSNNLLHAGEGTLILNGSHTQTVDLSGEFKTFNLEVQNPQNVLFEGTENLSIFGDLVLIDGIVYTQHNNLIKFKQNAVYFGASDFSYIDGPAIKEGNTAFRFPVGKLGKLRPIGISETSFLGSYQAEYFRETPSSLSFDTDLASVSDYEFWSLDWIFGVDNPKVTLTWNENSFINDPNDDLQIGYTQNMDIWSRITSATELPEQFETDLTSLDPISKYGYFTFSSLDKSTIMEDGVIDFELEKHSCTVHVNWNANERSARVSDYVIQRKNRDNDYEDVYSVDARNRSPLEDYLFVDRDLEEYEIYHYRIIVNYLDGTQKITEAKFILASCFPISMTLYPNPAYTDDILTLAVFSEIEKNLTIRVVDVLGRVLQTRVLEIKPGNNTYTIGDTQHYGAAEYFIWTPDIQEIPTLKFQIIR